MMLRHHAGALALTLFLATTTSAHFERPVTSPIRPGPVPDIFRANPNSLVVCKASSKPTKAEHDLIHRVPGMEAEDAAWHRNRKLFKRCRYEHIQEAVSAAADNTDIFILPGVYREEPSRAAPTTETGDLPSGAYSYEYHLANPNDANLIGIIGKHNITLEGTGARIEDVLVDGGFAKDVGIRCDRCTGIIVRNLWLRDVNEHGIYFIETDGYIFDRTRGSFARHYQLFASASDNGLFTDCEAEGGGDSGIYVGASPATNTVGRFSAEIRRCKMHHNALGFSGTQGNSVWMHDNDVYDNAIGLSFNSQNDHENFPQRFSLIENNLLHDNNFDIYDATSDVPQGSPDGGSYGPGYSFFRYPVGTGMWIVGGDDNIIRNNFIYNNKRFGTILAKNPVEAPLPANINRNHTVGNTVGRDPAGTSLPNSTAFPPGGDYAPGGSDFWWDETGNDNCWGPHDPDSGPIKTDPPNLTNPMNIPGPCPSTNVGGANPPLMKLQLLANCLLDGSSPPHTSDTFYPCPWGQVNNAPYLSRDEAECGNGIIDVGEDCDSGGYGGGSSMSFIPGETCTSLGRGSGTLACDQRLCTWDTTGCAAPSCTEYGPSKVRGRRIVPPPGDDDLDFRASFLASALFDPATEEVSFTFRDDDGLVHGATIPAGNPNWTSSGGDHTYRDPSGAFGRVVRIDIGFSGQSIRANVQVRGAGLASAADAVTGTVVLRVGNDCWSDTTPCAARGASLLCKGRQQP